MSENAIELRDVYLRRGQTHILNGLNWQVPAGSYVAVLGPNGCGKSTLARLVAGREWFSSGSVNVLGLTFGDSDLLGLRRRVMLAELGGSPPIDERLTTRDAVVTGLSGSLYLYHQPTPSELTKADAMLGMVGLAALGDRPVDALSAGEHRRALLARALIGEPELLIVDEPTAGLDMLAQAQLLATLDRLHAQASRTIVLITHHVEEIGPNVSHVLLMRKGQAVATGRPGQVLCAGPLSAAFGCPVQVQPVPGSSRVWASIHGNVSTWS